MIAGRYSLDREVGRGGTSAVWLGRDEVLGRAVALKRIGMLPGADTTDEARAERESRLSAQLNHPHVVAVFDVVVDGDSGARWLVMEYVDGPTLAQLIAQRGPLAPKEAAPLLRQVADALVAAHAVGIAHRDVKPSNIMIAHGDQAKLTDFGIARIATDPALTQTGLVTGSPAYLAPEIATGGRGDQAADVWSLGATAFYALAGRPPYDVGDNVLGTLYRIAHEEPPRLPEAGPLARFLEATLVKDPAQRWTMEQARDFLAAPSEPVAADTVVLPPVRRPADPHPDTAPTPIPAPASTRRAETDRPRPSPLLLAGLGLAGALIVAIVLAALLAGGDPTEEGPDPAADPTSSAPARPTQAGMKEFIRDYVTTVGEDPEESWKMLTPKFQRESGGLATYRDFWDEATNGRVLSIQANPDDLSVSYQVRFENFDNGPGPTVLDLVFEDGRYLIDGERSEGFVPAG